MQPFSSRIWTRVTVSISYDDNNYTTGTSTLFFSLLPACHGAYLTRQKKFLPFLDFLLLFFSLSSTTSIHSYFFLYRQLIWCFPLFAYLRLCFSDETWPKEKVFLELKIYARLIAILECIYFLPHKDCFIVSQLIRVAKHAIFLWLGWKPS